MTAMGLPEGRGAGSAGAGLHAFDGVLVVSVPAACDDRALTAIKTDVLAAVHAAAARGVVIDVSRLDFLDTVMFAALAETARMLGLLGARTLFVGFSPGVVSALIDMDVACEALQAAASLEDALDILRPAKTAPPQPDENPEDEPSGRDVGSTDAAEAGPDAGAGLDV